MRSLAATDVTAGADPPYNEPRPCLSGNGKVLAVELQRSGSWQQDIQVHWLDEGRKQVWQRGFDNSLVDDSSRHPALDRSGRWLAFSSLATRWVRGDDNSVSDVFCVDLQTSTLQRVLPPLPEPGLSASYDPSWSPQGDRLAFTSFGLPETRPEQGRGLVLAQPQGSGWSSRSLLGRPGRWGRGPVFGRASFSPSGEQIAFSAFEGGMTPEAWRPRFEVYASPLGGSWPPALHPERQRDFWDLVLLSHTPQGHPARGNSYQPVCAQTGVVFASLAPNLSPGDGNARHDLFFRPWSGVAAVPLTEGANESSFEPCCSADGRWIVFTSYADNLDVSQVDDNPSSDIYLLDRQLGRLQRLSQGLQGACFHPTCSEDARRVAFVHERRLMLWERGRGLRVLEARL